MGRDRLVLSGRDQELAALRDNLATPTGRLVVIGGAAGIGRSALLGALAESRTVGPQLIPVPFGAEVQAQHDTLGAGCLLAAVRDQFERTGDRQLARSIDAVARLRTATGGLPDHWLPTVLMEFGMLFGRLASIGPTVLLADDVHAVAEPALLLGAARRAGCLVLATYRDDLEPKPGILELITAADERIELGPLSDDQVEAVLARVAPAPLDESLLAALRTALGPLFGNPGSTLATFDRLRRENRLVVSHGRLCARDPAAPIVLPDRHPLIEAAHRLDRGEPPLLTAVAALSGPRVDDLPVLAEAIGAELADWGRTLDRLTDAGVLTVGPDGRMRYQCPALAASILAAGTAREPHRMIAELLLTRLRNGIPVEAAVLADRVVGAGTTLRADPELSAWLLTCVAHADQSDPERAVLWCAGAVRLATDDATRARTFDALLPLILRTGRYDLLRELLTDADVATWLADDPPAGLPIAAMLTTVHSAQPLPDSPATRQCGDPPVDAFDLPPWLRRRRTGGTSLSAAELDVMALAMAGDRDGCRSALRDAGHIEVAALRLDELVEAGAVGDLAAVIEIVLGPRYRVPDTGLLAGYHRVVRGYATGDWSGALSAARQLTLIDSADTVVHAAGRLYAAEICSARGDARQAAEWLAESKFDARLAPLRCFVEMGRATDPAAAADLAARQPAGPIRWRVLVRALEIAVAAGDQSVAKLVSDEMRDLYRTYPGWRALEVMFLGSAVLEGDPRHGWMALSLARRRGHQPDLLTTCLLVGPLVDDPRPWLHEAYDVARRCGSPVLVERVRAVLRQCGVAAPREKASGDEWLAHERQILELVQTGRTNQQIAAEIGMSEKTVENHLTRLFARTGCRSRVELAAAGVQGRLVVAAGG